MSRPSATMSSVKVQEEPRPRFIAFDLDYTLWPFWVDTHVSPPFSKASNGIVYDSYQREVKPYPDSTDVLAVLHSEGYVLAAASRTGCTREARDLVRLFGWDKYFSYKEIYPGSKVKHFEKFQRDTGFPFKEMLFFDDEQRNIRDVSELGVTSMHVRNGVNWNVVKEGLKAYAKNNGKK